MSQYPRIECFLLGGGGGGCSLGDENISFKLAKNTVRAFDQCSSQPTLYLLKFRPSSRSHITERP